MRKLSFEIVQKVSILSALILLLSSGRLAAQKLQFRGICGSWYKLVFFKYQPDPKQRSSCRVQFGFTFNKYFSTNYAFSTGLTISSGGGKLSNPDTIYMDVKKLSTSS